MRVFKPKGVWLRDTYTSFGSGPYYEMGKVVFEVLAK